MQIEKKFCGAPFGTQKSRFEVAGSHPKSRRPGTLTQVSYDRRSMLPQNRRLGPGTYNISRGNLDSNISTKGAPGLDWKRVYETSQDAKLPHFLYREEWERKQLQKRLLGPGTYNLVDSFDHLNKKPSSIRGVCQTRAARFPDELKEIPGPGTYGKGGIPHALMEEKQHKSASTVGMLDAGASRQLPETGSSVCPGQYNRKSFTDELANRVISKRGPYDLFTGDRNKPVSVGHLVIPNNSELGPGQYQVKSFLDELTSGQKKQQGRFGKVARYPNVPIDRIHCSTLSQCPRAQEEPGPGSYNLDAIRQPDSSKRPPFGLSAERNDKKATQFFLGSHSSVGPGRYNTTYDRKQHKNTLHSVFNSNTNRWDSRRDKYLMERIREKDVLVKDRVFLVPPTK